MAAEVGILINDNININNIYHEEKVTGRMQVVRLEINDSKIALINLYAPNTDSLNFFNTLEQTIEELSEYNLIIGGDFNVVMNFEEDKLNGRDDTNKNVSNKINQIKNMNDLIDIYRNLNPYKREYTWHSNNTPPIFCRLDYFLISESIQSNMLECKIKPGYKSDHSIVILKLNLIDCKPGPGYFKLNNSLLFDTEYKKNNLRRDK